MGWTARGIPSFPFSLANPPDEITLENEASGAVMRYVPERTCRMEVVKHGPCYITYRFDCCGGEWAESLTDAGATDLPGTVCPFCGARVKEGEWPTTP